MNNLAINLETGLEEKKHADKNAPKAGDAKGGDVKDGNAKTESEKQDGKPVPEAEAAA